MAARVIVVVEDLIFLSKIQQTAKLLGIAMETAKPTSLREQMTAGGIGAVILDLNHGSGQAVALLQQMKSDPVMQQVTVVGFLSHVQTGLAAEARAAGCDVLLARSAFNEKLSKILQHYAGIEPSPAS